MSVMGMGIAENLFKVFLFPYNFYLLYVELHTFYQIIILGICLKFTNSTYFILIK